MYDDLLKLRKKKNNKQTNKQTKEQKDKTTNTKISYKEINKMRSCRVKIHSSSFKSVSHTLITILPLLRFDSILTWASATRSSVVTLSIIGFNSLFVNFSIASALKESTNSFLY